MASQSGRPIQRSYVFIPKLQVSIHDPTADPEDWTKNPIIGHLLLEKPGTFKLEANQVVRVALDTWVNSNYGTVPPSHGYSDPLNLGFGSGGNLLLEVEVDDPDLEGVRFDATVPCSRLEGALAVGASERDYDDGDARGSYERTIVEAHLAVAEDSACGTAASHLDLQMGSSGAWDTVLFVSQPEIIDVSVDVALHEGRRDDGEVCYQGECTPLYDYASGTDASIGVYARMDFGDFRLDTAPLPVSDLSASLVALDAKHAAAAVEHHKGKNWRFASIQGAESYGIAWAKNLAGTVNMDAHVTDIKWKFDMDLGIEVVAWDGQQSTRGDDKARVKAGNLATDSQCNQSWHQLDRDGESISKCRGDLEMCTFGSNEACSEPLQRLYQAPTSQWGPVSPIVDETEGLADTDVVGAVGGLTKWMM